MRIIPIASAAALLVSPTAAWSQPSYCDKAQCKAWTGPGWYVIYGGYFGPRMLKAGPFPDQASCKAEAARLTDKSPKPEGEVVEVGPEYFCLIVGSGEAAKEYMIPV